MRKHLFFIRIPSLFATSTGGVNPAFLLKDIQNFRLNLSVCDSTQARGATT